METECPDYDYQGLPDEPDRRELILASSVGDVLPEWLFFTRRDVYPLPVRFGPDDWRVYRFERVPDGWRRIE